MLDKSKKREVHRMDIDEKILERAREWLKPPYKPDSIEQVKQLIDKGGANLVNAFYKDLEFGTGGLRGIMGVGTNRINSYNIQKVTQGLANYLNQFFAEKKKSTPIQVAIAYDSRNRSDYFAKTAADVFTANGIKVYLFTDLKPTPELSFAVRHLQCHAGIVITASHNPKEYNGYKVYWQDGSQIISPHDVNIINEVKKITSLSLVKTSDHQNHLILPIDEEIDRLYYQKVIELCNRFNHVSPKESLLQHRMVKIVYTPLHGAGLMPAISCLQKLEFDVSVVASQQEADGNFPTLTSPNPEEASALSLAIKQAKDKNAHLVLGTDPDADRVGLAVPDDINEATNSTEEATEKKSYLLLNGNQSAVLLTYFLLTTLKNQNKLQANHYIVKTIVTTHLIEKIAQEFDVEILNVLTGFKYIANIIEKRRDTHAFLYGCEESYGYLVDDFVRDKDAIISCCLFAKLTLGHNLMTNRYCKSSWKFISDTVSI